MFTLLDGLVHVSGQQVWYDKAVKTVVKQIDLLLMLKELDRLLIELWSDI